MSFYAQNITKTFFCWNTAFYKNCRLSTFQIVVWALFCRISTFWLFEHFLKMGFCDLFQWLFTTQISPDSWFAFFHLPGVHPSFSENNLMKLLRERKPEDSASFCILISGCSFSMFFAYSNRRLVIHSRNVILYVVLI